ncbi:hypothetical protein ABLB90_16970 [Photorhabdus bodei]|uniref:hypothetical protein n=1 Tax=Photorhabdus TaxID=29487 RepID=UPI00232F3061|nr:hypothetical protein [Photorhabdus bodei]MDB6369367.1 hypothetical protein [Photorhabdus bodei]
MKIQESDGSIVDVFAIYWFGDETYFYGLPPNYRGLQAYKSHEVSVIDTTIGFKTVFFSNDDAKSVHHWALIEEQLLDDLLELDETAYQRFLAILKAEGNIEQDFC